MVKLNLQIHTKIYIKKKNWRQAVASLPCLILLIRSVMSLSFSHSHSSISLLGGLRTRGGNGSFSSSSGMISFSSISRSH